MRTLSYILIAAISLTLLPQAVFAQEKEPLVGLEDQIEAARKLMRTERKLVIAAELNLTPDEAKAFWPLYGEYSTEVQKISDRKVNLITTYADNFNRISDAFASRSLSEALSIDAAYSSAREIYLQRFKQILPIVKVVRFYQVENKLNAVVNFQLAAQIPLMVEPE